jgi:hypothetical protein
LGTSMLGCRLTTGLRGRGMWPYTRHLIVQLPLLPQIRRIRTARLEEDFAQNRERRDYRASRTPSTIVRRHHPPALYEERDIDCHDSSHGDVPRHGANKKDTVDVER